MLTPIALRNSKGFSLTVLILKSFNIFSMSSIVPSTSDVMYSLLKAFPEENAPSQACCTTLDSAKATPTFVSSKTGELSSSYDITFTAVTNGILDLLNACHIPLHILVLEGKALSISSGLPSLFLSCDTTGSVSAN